MAFALGASMPKAMLKLPIFKTYPQPRKAIIVSRVPPRPGGSSGSGGQINREKPASFDSAKIVIKETENKNKAVIKEDSSSAKNKSNKEASN